MFFELYNCTEDPEQMHNLYYTGGEPASVSSRSSTPPPPRLWLRVSIGKHSFADVQRATWTGGGIDDNLKQALALRLRKEYTCSGAAGASGCA
jgi:hypothetical protein